ncbi:hypothetical protein SDRG_08165 [Saprolegnia diclina VS20]|uniref:C3H1-type domain-containing protein n=1 Tax=Saprolegnia diclina (strain VS20) TaxID=1156394 RepID=T0QKS4_SAPDV|nr:hypothetical protein SDRG_08165 [Saprolegnia diclina VS20]EQC34395.1 hypothetical protein SDRG_08165 [Saprolegnia diclina VS20]|eukprot:XP_008612257.1 hypothetical protein SDRG_08165 [Saprolegnia diclina VS20]
MYGNNRGRNNQFGNNDRGGRGGRGRGGRSNYSGGNRFANCEICTFHLDDRCQRDNCRAPHFLKRLGMASGHNGTVRDVALWGQQAFTASSDGTLRLWALDTMKEAAVIPQCKIEIDTLPVEKSKKVTEGVSSLLLESPFLFVGYEEQTPAIPDVPVGRIQCWNLENPSMPPMELAQSVEMPFAMYRNVTSLAMAKHPATGAPIIFSGGADGRIAYWMFDAATNAFTCAGVMEGHALAITRLKVVQLGATTALISSSRDHTIRIWDVATYKCGTVLSRATGGHANIVLDIEIWVSNGEPFLISSGYDQQIIVWQLSPPFAAMYTETLDSPALAICTTTDAVDCPLLLLGHDDGSIVVKELPSFKYKTIFGKSQTNVGHTDAVRRIVPGPAHTFFTTSGDRKMMAWQVTGKISDIQS